MLLYERLRNKFAGYIAWKLSGLDAKRYINMRMYVARSKSKRRHAISPLNNRILEIAKHSHHYSHITSEDLKGLSRTLRVIFLNIVRQNPMYGVMFDEESSIKLLESRMHV